MKKSEAQVWAKEVFGEVELGDERLRQRAIEIGAAMQRRPADTLPQQMGNWARTKAAYRFFANEKVDHGKLSQPHWEQTRQAAKTGGEVVLMVQDVTDINYSSKPTTEGLGPIGRSDKGQGLMVHNTVAIRPEEKAVIGLAYQQVWVRDEIKRKGKETKAERLARTDRQSMRWEWAVQAIGRPPDGMQWVHVGDSEADNFTLFETVKAQGCDFLFRLGQDRRLLEWTPEEGGWILTEARQLEVKAHHLLSVPAQRGRPARIADMAVTWSPMTLRSPKAEAEERTFSGVLIRCWELNPPAGQEPLEWVLLTTVPIEAEADALRCLEWYSCRWIVEEYHSCLKTGCSVEESRLRHADRLLPRLAMLSIVAVSLLQLRSTARQRPDLSATEAVDPLLVHLVAQRDRILSPTMSVRQFWHAVACIGGYLDRRRDPEPGWKSLWHGWLRLQDWAEGVRLYHDSLPL
jgi:hypothetical protein